MIVAGNWDNRPVTISVKSNCLTISLDGPYDADVFSYDFAGRLWTAFFDRISYRRGLDGKMIAKWRADDGQRRRRWLAREEALSVEIHARQLVKELVLGLDSGLVRLQSALPESGRTALTAALAFDTERSEADAAAYHRVYKPVGILPPDQYMAVVLQATEGCSFNTCSFCSFYKDRPFLIKPPDVFRAHALAVREFLGAGLSLRRTLFLGDANALVVPMARLLPLLGVVHEVYDVAALGGIYAFLDGFSGDKKSVGDYRALAAQGLKRVYIGLESGSADLLTFLHKPGKPADAVQAVRAMKASGVAVGVIVLLGAGGHLYADAHVRDTITAINAMRLDEEDIVYFSELIAGDDLPYAQDAERTGLLPLSPQELILQGEAIEAGLRFNAGMPKISRYDIREFIY
jgi:hypothetical protein